MPTTERMKPISLFVPFEPIERRSKDEPLIVSGYCFVNETVEGEGGIILERSAMEAATPEYMTRRTIREMHQPMAAGVAESVDWDEKGCHLTARIVDPVARMKVEEGVYRGFSLKIRPLQRVGNRLTVVKWGENSLVDDGADPDCNDLVIHRADDFDPAQEVEVEVLDVAAEAAPALPAAPEAATPPVPAEGPGVLSLPSHSSEVPPAEASPPAADTPAAGGTSSHTEEERAALLAAGISEAMLASVEVVAAERALGLPVVAMTPGNSDVTADVEDVDEALGGGLPGDYRVEQAPTGMWCAYGPAGDKLGEFATEAEARAHVAACKAAMDGVGLEDEPGERAAALTGLRDALLRAQGEIAAGTLSEETRAAVAAAFERAQTSGSVPSRENQDGKPKGEYGSVKYADPGYQDDKKPRYPIDTKEHVKAAWSYINQADNASAYSAADLAKVKAKIMAAAKEVGVEISDEAKERAAVVDPVGPFLTYDRGDDGLYRWAIHRANGSVAISVFDFEKACDHFRQEIEATKARAAVVEAPPAAPEPQVSRADVRDDPTEIRRLEATNAELLQRLAVHEETLTRLAAAEAEVQRLRKLPLDTEKPPTRYFHSLDRSFTANLGNQGEAEIAVLRADYEAAKKEAEEQREGDRTKLNRATERMILRASQLAERGVYV